MRSTVAAFLIRPLLSFGEAVLQGTDLSGVDFDDPEARVDYLTMIELSERVQRITGDDRLGLYGAQLAAGTLRVFEYMARTSLTSYDALTRISRYQALLHDACGFSVVRGREEATACIDIKHSLPLPGHVAEFFMASLFLGLYRLGVPPQGAAYFSHQAPADRSQHEALFRVPLHFGCERNLAVFPLSGLDQPLPESDPALCASLERHAQQMLQRLPRTTGFAERVRTLLSQDLARGEPSLEELASRLSMSPRTLRRRLAEAQTTFQSLLDELRKELALAYVEGGDPSFGAEQAAFLLGFSEASSFRRAFKRWTGQSYAEYRQRFASRSPGATH